MNQAQDPAPGVTTPSPGRFPRRHGAPARGKRALTALAAASLAFRMLTSVTAAQSLPEADVAEALPDQTEEPGLQTAEVLPSLEDDEDEETSALETPDTVPAAPLGPQRPRWGFTAGLAVKSFYDSNIFIQPRHGQSDWVSQIEPSLRFGVGDYLGKAEGYLGIDYTARASVFAFHSGEDSLDHDLRIGGLVQVRRFDFRFGVHLKTATEENIDAGNRTREKLGEATLTARYELTGHAAIEADLLARKQEYSGLLSSTELRLTSWIAYRVTSRIDESLGVAFGRLTALEGAGQTYGQILSRTRLLETARLTAGLRAGVEYRQYESSSKASVNPVFALDLDYDSHTGRTLHLEAFRKTEISNLYANENRVETGLQAALKQHLTGKLSASLAAEVGESEYTSTTDSSSASRRDFFYAVTPSLVYEPSEHWSLSLFVSFRRDDSTQAAFSFTDLQAGVAAQVSY